MLVEQFHVKNQFLIHAESGTYLQSYNTIIAFIDNKGKITLDVDKWGYSVTTSKQVQEQVHRSDNAGDKE